MATLVDSLASDIAQELRRVEVASNVSVSLGYDRAAVEHHLDASGFVADSAASLDGLRPVRSARPSCPIEPRPARSASRVFPAQSGEHPPR